MNHSCLRFLAGNKNAGFWREKKRQNLQNFSAKMQKKISHFIALIGNTEHHHLRLFDHTNAEHLVYKSFHQGWPLTQINCLAFGNSEKFALVFFKDTATHWQFRNRTGGQQGFDRNSTLYPLNYRHHFT